MPLSFAIAAEGKTDQRVVENILVGFFRSAPSEIIVDWDHPAHQVNPDESAESWGNWLNVLEYLRRRSYQDALQYHEYLVVQIDTDCADKPGFDVALEENGVKRTADEIVTAVRTKLESLIDPVDLQAYSGKFLFAICVDSVECWLLPLHCPEKATDENNCLFKVNGCLARDGQDMIRKNHVPSYANASAPYRREKTLKSEGPKQRSLARFLELLERIDPAN